jgi:hypothetical protein
VAVNRVAVYCCVSVYRLSWTLSKGGAIVGCDCNYILFLILRIPKLELFENEMGRKCSVSLLQKCFTVFLHYEAFRNGTAAIRFLYSLFMVYYTSPSVPENEVE